MIAGRNLLPKIALSLSLTILPLANLCFNEVSVDLVVIVVDVWYMWLVPVAEVIGGQRESTLAIFTAI